MATMVSELYDALKAAGAPEEQARKAAEVVANHDSRFLKIEAELTLIKWMVGSNIAFVLLVLGVLLRR